MVFTSYEPRPRRRWGCPEPALPQAGPSLPEEDQNIPAARQAATVCWYHEGRRRRRPGVVDDVGAQVGAGFWPSRSVRASTH